MPKQKTKNSTNGERNWSELPQDILHLFSKKLPDISDFIHFRTVCKSWQLSVAITDPPPQLPWLLECQHSENHLIRFYCLSSGKVQTINFPDSCRFWLNGPGCCYLLSYHLGSSERYLLNPLTKDKIYIPDIKHGFLPDYIGLDPIEGCDIVIVSGHTNLLAFWRPKADDWVYVEGVGNYCSGKAYYMGQYFSNNNFTGITNVIDIATNKLAYQVAPPEDTNPHLIGRTFIVVSGGKILRLFHHSKAEPCHFDIYYLYFGDGEGKPCWMKITDIGDQMLFLQYYRGLSICASNFSGFKGNCIYFVKKWRYLCRYDIGDGTSEVLHCPFDDVATWLVPSLV